MVLLPGFSPDDESAEQRFHVPCPCGAEWIVQRVRIEFENGPLDDVEWIAQVQLYDSGRLISRSTGRDVEPSRRLSARRQPARVKDHDE